MTTQKQRFLDLTISIQALATAVQELENCIKEMESKEMSHPKANIRLLKWEYEIEYLTDKITRLQIEINQSEMTNENSI